MDFPRFFIVDFPLKFLENIVIVDFPFSFYSGFSFIVDFHGTLIEIGTTTFQSPKIQKSVLVQK